MKSLGTFVRLTRIEHALMLDIAVLIAIVIGEKSSGVAAGVVAGAGGAAGGAIAAVPFPTLLLALCVAPLVQMASFALNDYFDVETDRRNGKKERPLVSGEASMQEALAITAACYLLGNAVAYALGMQAFFIAFLFSIFSIAYNWRLKDVALAGNLYIAATMAIPFVFGSVIAAGRITPAACALSAIAFVVGLAREIMKTAQDYEGDKKARKSRTLPAYIGEGNSLRLAGILFALFVPLSYIPFFYGVEANFLSLGFVTVGNFALLALAYSLIFEKAEGKGSKAAGRAEGRVAMLKRGRDASLMALFAGLVGYLAGSL